MSVAESLSKNARQLEVTESEYVSNALKHKLTVEALTQNIGGIALSNDIFQGILGQVNASGMEIAAYEIAKKNTPFEFELPGLDLTVSSIEWFINEVLQNYGWFRVEVVRKENDEEMKLFHKYGSKWSLFLASYITSMFETLLRQRPNVSMDERIVKLTLAKHRMGSEPTLT